MNPLIVRNQYVQIVPYHARRSTCLIRIGEHPLLRLAQVPDLVRRAELLPQLAPQGEPLALEGLCLGSRSKPRLARVLAVERGSVALGPGVQAGPGRGGERQTCRVDIAVL